jgi:hypothetical protein
LETQDEIIAQERSSILGEAAEQDKQDEVLVAQGSACGFYASACYHQTPQAEACATKTIF